MMEKRSVCVVTRGSSSRRASAGRTENQSVDSARWSAPWNLRVVSVEPWRVPEEERSGGESRDDFAVGRGH